MDINELIKKQRIDMEKKRKAAAEEDRAFDEQLKSIPLTRIDNDEEDLEEEE